MKNAAVAFRAAVSIAVAMSAAACAVSTQEQEQEQRGGTSEALAKGGGLGMPPISRVPPPPPPPPQVAFPPANASYCPSVEPSCSVDPIPYVRDDDAQLRALGCSHVQHWFTGNSSGLLGGLFTLCPDSAALRAKYGTGFAFDSVTCSACVPAAPAGEVYVLLEGFVGPNCESGCLTHPFNPITTVPSDGAGL